jgi:hypothetical protein
LVGRDQGSRFPPDTPSAVRYPPDDPTSRRF